jgi:23S rRNA (uracil1939-C5)-methyltransferase
MVVHEFTVVPGTWMPRGEALSLDLPCPTAIWQGIPGEKSLIHVYHRGRNLWMGRWLEAIEQADPERVDPPCDRYSACGGCPLMHLTPVGQRRVRLDLLRKAFEDEDVPLGRVAEVVPFEGPQREFRHVVKLAAGRSERGNLRLGAYGRNSHAVIPIPECLVATPSLREAMKVVSHHMIGLAIPPWDAETGRGLLRYVVLRQSRASGDVLVTLVAAHFSAALVTLAEEIGRGFPAVVGVHLHVNDGEGNAIFQHDGDGLGGTRHLVGKGVIEERLCGARFRIGPGDFFQTNPSMAEKLATEAVGALLPGRPLVDLYSGVGSIALLGAATAGWAIGVEEVESAVLRARENASLNGVPAEFVMGQVLSVLPEIQTRLGATRPNVVVNPARRGLEEGVLGAILALDPARVLYVSCNPRTLARDLRDLLKAGFHLASVTPFDMFPNTSHVETLVVLDPSSAARDEPSRGPRRRRVGA